MRRPTDNAEVEVWEVALNAVSGTDEILETTLDAREVARANAFRTAELRRRFVAAHGALRQIVADRLGVEAGSLRLGFASCPVCGGPHGRPILVEPSAQLHFSLSHSRDTAVVALSERHVVGADVEEIEPSCDGDYAFDGVLPAWVVRHLETLQSSERAAVAYAIWTVTEALLKATGTGLAGDIDAAAAAAFASLTQGSAEFDTRRWTIESFRTHRGATVAIAVEAAKATVRRRSWTPQRRISSRAAA